jgi:adenylate kinase
MVLNLIFLGPPGTGKGTVAQAVTEKYGLEQISTGDLIREEIASNSDLGKELAEIVNKGQLISDEQMGKMLEEKLKELSSREDFRGVILDGFPRTVPQAKELENILSRVNQKLNSVIYIESSEEEIVKRLSSRRTCAICKKVYNLVSMPPEIEGKCSCGGDLIQRDDDKPETIRKRYETFLEKTSPLINYYEEKGLLKKYDGNVPPKESIDSAMKIIEELL